MVFIKSIFVNRINSFPIILDSLSVILFLININYNRYIAKIITFIGPLTYGVFIIHENLIIRAIFIRDTFKNYSMKLPLETVIRILVVKSSTIFITCIIIDYFRDILFRVLQIRKLCMLIEKMIFTIFG